MDLFYVLYGYQKNKMAQYSVTFVVPVQAVSVGGRVLAKSNCRRVLEHFGVDPKRWRSPKNG
jgi:hypothetical protein